MPRPLLIEIGCEEIPARMVRDIAQQFQAKLLLHLEASQLLADPSSLSTNFTPRRLLLHAPALAERQPDREEEITGPPVRVARDAASGWTPQASGFAAKNGVPADRLYVVKTAKGEYVALRKHIAGRSAVELLAEMIPRSLGEIALPRAMRWEDRGAGGLRFIRPVRWLVGMFGDEVLAFQIGGLTAGNVSHGHRSLGQAAFTVAPNSYPQAWHANHVIVAPEARQAAILTAAQRVLAGAGLRLRPDAELLETLVNLTEFPDAILGGFEPGYLTSLPHAVLVTVMRDHQKYFAVEDATGALAPHFIAVINQEGDQAGLIRHGHERVLRARFSDAQFFWDTDRKLTLSERLPLLDHVTFHVKLGSYRQKSRRLRVLANWLAEQWPGTHAGQAEVAAELAKCDLTTEMVKEFTELQGIMGGYYARAEGQDAVIADAIADQYLWETPPRTQEGAAVSLADKLDTIAGMFSIGETPSGSADPFGLRRQGNGLIKTLMARELPLSLAAGCDEALRGYNAEANPGLKAELAGFLRERLAFYLSEAEGFAYDIVAAVLGAGADRPLEARARCRALAAAPNTAAVAAVIKRARNIVRKENWTGTSVDPARLSAAAETALWSAVNALPAGGDYAAELAAIAGLAPVMEEFFNQVRVNDPDAAVRANRLALLAATVERLSRIADFSELAVSLTQSSAG